MFKFTSILKYSLVLTSLMIPADRIMAEPTSNSTIESRSNSSDSYPISFFRKSPRLIDSNTSFSSVGAWSRYNFVINVPTSAESDLGKIVINQQQNFELIDIYPDESRVVLLTDRGDIPVESEIDFIYDDKENTSVIIVNLLESVPAGSTIKVALRARNPYTSGVYLYGVEVFADGENPRSLRLGIARFNFYDRYR